MHIQLDSYEDGLTKELQIDMDKDYLVNAVDSHIEGQLEIMQKSIWEKILKGHEVWCTKFLMVGGKKILFSIGRTSTRHLVCLNEIIL